MAIITLKINERTKAGQIFLAFVNQFVLTHKSVEVVEEKSPYDPEFVKKIKKAQKRADYIEVNPNDVWGSLGLK